MGTVNKDLGAVSAYGFAKDSGYTGTVTQFETGLAAAANLGSTITTALNSKADLVSGTVPSSQLPSYVDDVIDGYYYNESFYSDSSHTEAITPETGKIYIDITTNGSYRWSGTAFVEIASNSISYDNGAIFSKIAGTLTLSTDSVSLDDDHITATVTVSNATGAVSVSSSNASVATASISSNIITISSVNNAVGSATITVSTASTGSYSSASDTIAVTTSFRAAGAVTLSTSGKIS